MELAKLNLLLAVEDPADAHLLLDALKEVDVEVSLRQEPTMSAALKAARTELFDLIVLDLNLHDALGLDSLRVLRSVNSTAAIAALTSIVPDAIEHVFEGQPIINRSEPATRLAGRLLSLVDHHRQRTHSRQLELLVAHHPDAVIVVDQSGVVQFVNEAALTLFQKQREDFEGELLGFSIPEGELVEIEITRERDSRIGAMHVVDFEWRGAPATLAAIRDVTDTVRRGRRSAQPTSRGASDPALAREVSGLLTTILGYSGYLLTEEIDWRELQSHLYEIHAAGLRVTPLVQGLLDRDRPEDGIPRISPNDAWQLGAASGRDIIDPALLAGTETVLLVEGEETIRELMQLVLEGQGYKVLSFEDGLGALAIVEEGQHRVDLLLTGLTASEVSGPELALAVRARHPRAKTLYVTDYAGQARDGAVELPPELLLDKPFGVLTLLRKVRSVLEQGLE